MAKIREEKGDRYAKCRVVLDVLGRIGDKWTVMVVGALADGPRRFNAIMQFIDGVSHRMLTLTLRSLERDGLVKRTAYATIPPKVEYELTPLGRSVIVPLKSLSGWAMEKGPLIEEARMQFDAAREQAGRRAKPSTEPRQVREGEQVGKTIL